MGSNLARNLASREGNTVAIFNRSYEKTQGVLDAHPEAGFIPAADLRGVRRQPAEAAHRDHHGQGRRRHRRRDRRAGEACSSPATSSSTAATPTSPTPSAARRRCAPPGINFVGAGISGGEEGALTGPSIMPGGSDESWVTLGPILRSIAAVAEGEPCVTHVGHDGAGHFVKMVHNGIEYADMQLIAEAYDLIRRGTGQDPGRDRRDLRRVEPRRAGELPHRDHRRGAAPGRRRQPASRSWTSSSTRPAPRAPVPGPCRPRCRWACRSPGSPRRPSPAPSPRTPSSASVAATLPGPDEEFTVDRRGRLHRGRAPRAVRLEDRRLLAGLRRDPRGRGRVRLEHRPRRRSRRSGAAAASSARSS